MKSALYPGTFDPITNGHVDLVHRAAAIFDKIIVTIAINAKKTPLFSLTQRIELAEAVFSSLPNVEVCSFDGLMIHFAQQKKVSVILRGIRSTGDMEYEFQLAHMNHGMANNIETLFMAPAPQYAYVSATLVREIAIMGGDVSPFIPPVVLTAFDCMRNK